MAATNTARQELKKQKDSLEREYDDLRDVQPFDEPANDNEPNKQRGVIRNVERVMRLIPQRPTRVRGPLPLNATSIAIRSGQRFRLPPHLLIIAGIIYTVQLAFAVISLIGLATLGGLDTSSLISAVDTVAFGSVGGMGEGLFLIGLVVALLCAVILAVMSAIILTAAGAHPGRGHSLLILLIVLWMHLWPIFNLFPMIGFWYVYVALSE